jgi:hypothetical protein
MKLTENITLVRAKGSLVVTLEDGREAELEVDLDLSHPATEWGQKLEYLHNDLNFPQVPTRPIATTWYVTVPTTVDEGLPFTLRIPVSS